MELVTCFTLCAIKSWCAAAIESVHSVCTGPVVLTGMTCAIIDICFKGRSRVNDVYVWPWMHTYPSSHFIIIPDLTRLEVMTMEVQAQVCWARVTLGHVYDFWQHLQRNGHMLQTSIKVISSEKKQNDCSCQELGKRFMFWFLCDYNGQRQICRSLPFSSGCQLLGDTFWLAHNRSWTLLFYLFTRTCYLLRLPVSHCVPLNPGAQWQLNPFTRSVQVPLFLQGWPAQSSISVLRR